MTAAERRALLRAVKLVVFDFDGVMTDNRVLVCEDGRESVFCSRGDGMGIGLLKQAGVIPFILSTEANGVVSARARKLAIDVVQNCPDKAAALRDLVATLKLSPEEVVYVGNDVNDRECLEYAGVPVCVADAHPSVLPLASLVTSRRGGRGAVREVCDWVVDARGAESR